MKGFKKDGKFRPTEKRNKSALTKHDVVFKKPVSFGDNEFKEKKMGTTIQEQKVTDIFNFNELDDDAKETAREWIRGWITDDNNYAEDDGLLYDDKRKIEMYVDIFDEPKPTQWSVGWGSQYIQFDELKVKNIEAFRNWLGISKPLWERLGYEFVDHDTNTSLQLFDEEVGYEVSDPEFSSFTEKQREQIENAKERFDDLMTDALKHLEDNFEYETSDENLDEVIEINEYTFDRKGNRK